MAPIIVMSIMYLIPGTGGCCRIQVQGLPQALRTDEREMRVMDDIMNHAESLMGDDVPDILGIDWLEEDEELLATNAVQMACVSILPY
ncbi:unnamed protein product [Orchesella dallaii]|uniref:Uncharacterized protein n=1 Tax=Orchesella dallaii TaxID=48710 RepID=A0ABP1R5S0_9HEXA